MPQPKEKVKANSFLASIGMTARKFSASNVVPVSEIKESDAYLYGSGQTTVASLLGSTRHVARSRQQIYNKWSMMESDPIGSTAIGLLVTCALGGHETSGDLVFIEKTVEAKKNKRLEAVVDEISASLSPIINREARSIAYTGTAFGDSYARIYTQGSRGVVDLYTGEMIRPQLVQPFERGNRTVGYAVYTGPRNFDRLDITQMARLKMPRTQWVAQFGVVEKAAKIAITEDNIDNLPIMPSMAGGSLFYNAEGPYDNLYSSLVGIVGQRWLDSIDEQMLQVNLTSMTIEQQNRFLASIKAMLTSSKQRAEDAVKNGQPVLERIRHIIPTFNEKQLTTVSNSNGGQTGRTNNISIEDIMLHARMYAGAIGVDLAMLGFADQLAGGLGEGGFFRMSAQAAENSRIIRNSLAEFIYHVIDIHTMHKYGTVFDPDKRPFTVNFYGSISALEAEKQRTKADSMNSGMMLVQAMQQMKDLGATEEMMKEFLSKTMMLDEDQAKMYAPIVKMKDENPDDGPGGGPGFGQGFGQGKMDSAIEVEPPIIQNRKQRRRKGR
ncbi:hypothetical protein Nit79A3_1433 [Nitrosomonas sp. Is79A3]|uniref:hypothetical protein n=1 Tax=Nitrosomonas sp. (strain Is79A3) TaxID=261292 RepID=UPI000215CFFA